MLQAGLGRSIADGQTRANMPVELDAAHKIFWKLKIYGHVVLLVRA
jgi:hypothetical protein